MIPVPLNFIGRHQPLLPGDITSEAATLGVKLSLIHAFSDLESGVTGGFLKTGEPIALYEARYFHMLTGGKYDHIAPNISSPVWNRTLYGAGGVHQYARLRQAMALDRTAALESCSIGRYQQMAADWHKLGFSSVDDMWGAFCDSEHEHLLAFGEFCIHANLIHLMQQVPPDYIRIAIGYNGPGERANGYDTKLKAADVHYMAVGEGRVPKLGAMYGGQSRAENPMTFGA